MLDIARNRPNPPSFGDPPPWLEELHGFDLFRPTETPTGSSIMPDGVDEATELEGDWWRVTLLMPADVAALNDAVDPVLLLALLANGSAKVEDKIEELVAHCRHAGKSWTDIGRGLGVSKQAAWERYSGED